MGNTEGALLQHGGCTHLRSYKVAEAVYDATVVFCERFIEKRSRTREQMVQAARSGVRSVKEVSGAVAASFNGGLVPDDCARTGCSDELAGAFKDFLVQRGLRVWHKDSPDALAIRERLKHDGEPAAKSSCGGLVRLSGLAGLSGFVAKAEPELAANAMLCAVNQAAYLFRRLLEGQGRGGLAGRLSAPRINAGGQEASDVQMCELCGKSMVLRTARKGPHFGSRFWGCTGYPGCRGIKEAFEVSSKPVLSD